MFNIKLKPVQRLYSALINNYSNIYSYYLCVQSHVCMCVNVHGGHRNISAARALQVGLAGCSVQGASDLPISISPPLGLQVPGSMPTF